MVYSYVALFHTEAGGRIPERKDRSSFVVRHSYFVLFTALYALQRDICTKVRRYLVQYTVIDSSKEDCSAQG